MAEPRYNNFLKPLMIGVCLALVAALGVGVALADDADSWRYKIDDAVFDATAGDDGEFLVFLSEQADLSPATALAEKSLKGRYVVDTLQNLARRTQAPIVAVLDAAGVSYQTFWLTNLILVQGDLQILQMLAQRDDVERIRANPRVRLAEPEHEDQSPWDGGTRSIEWNISLIGAPAVWVEGDVGQDGVVGGIDTGIDWDHPALVNQYRGNSGMTVDHDYNWHDAIHSGGGDCGPDSPEPCDDHSHGTHTMGTMVGDDGGSNQIGVAPGARWIGCRCMDEGFGTPASYIECLEFMVAPYPVSGTSGEGDPTRAPDVINNSWSCPENEGCTWDTLQLAIENVRAAGIVVVTSAGNGGPECGSIDLPPAIYDAAFSVGATSEEDEIKTFSSRGPVYIDGSGRAKPDVSAPGAGVRSAMPGGDYDNMSGTSMAAPHVAGLVALLVTADPTLHGNVDLLETLITATAIPFYDDQCGGSIPDNVYGYGRIDAFAAYSLAPIVAVPTAGNLPRIVQLQPAVPNPFNPTTTISYLLPEPMSISLVVYDAAGRLVRVLVGNAYKAAGRHQVTWNGGDESGQIVAAGVYFCRLESRVGVETERITLVK